MSFWQPLGDLMVAGEEGPGFHRLVIPLFLGSLLQTAAHGRSNRNLRRDQAGFALIHKPRRTRHRLENLHILRKQGTRSVYVQQQAGYVPCRPRTQAVHASAYTCTMCTVTPGSSHPGLSLVNGQGRLRRLACEADMGRFLEVSGPAWLVGTDIHNTPDSVQLRNDYRVRPAMRAHTHSHTHATARPTTALSSPAIWSHVGTLGVFVAVDGWTELSTRSSR